MCVAYGTLLDLYTMAYMFPAVHAANLFFERCSLQNIKAIINNQNYETPFRFSPIDKKFMHE